MKLSTAIIKGSKGIIQTTETLKDDIGYCALGAACRALNIRIVNRQNESLKLRAIYPFLGEMTGNSSTLVDKIVEHNDHDNWSFKKIASWLKRKGY